MTHSIYDLHTHSHCSDGELTPTALVEAAKARGVSVLGLTDHDTVAGVSEAYDAANGDIDIVAGIELSCLWKGRNIHIVGLNIDIENPVLSAGIEQQGKARVDRAAEIARRLTLKGIDGALEGARGYSGNGIIGRPHFARYLVDNGHVKTMAQAFKQYLGTGKVGDVKQCWPSIDTAIAWIMAAGGTAVLAHPDKYGLTRTKLYSLLEAFVIAGGGAIEVVNGVQDNNVTLKLVRAANDFNLLASCGSDFHREGQPWQALGCCRELPEQCNAIWDSWL